jgi:microcompartment protein CcmK/EutM
MWAHKTPSLRQSQTKLVVMVFSRREGFERRQTIRETWGAGHDNVLFMVGNRHCPYKPSDRVQWSCNPKKGATPGGPTYDREQKALTEKLRQEEKVVLLDMVDVYRGLPEKLRLGYKWVLEHHKPQWILKTDDDSVVRVGTLEDYLVRTYDATKTTIIGEINRGTGVPRSGKWKDWYPKKRYPPWPRGSVGHVVSHEVAEYIATTELVDYQGEDVSVGIWMDESPLSVQWKNTKHFTAHGKCKDTSKWVIGHNISPQRMKECFQHRDEMVEAERPGDVGGTVCPFTPPTTKEQHNGGWLYTKKLILTEHVSFDEGFGNALVEYWGNTTVYDIGAGVGQFKVFSKGSSVRTWAFDGGNNIAKFEGIHAPLRKDPNYIVPKVCWIDASVPLTMAPKEWVMSIEVGEHIAKAREHIFLDNLVRLATRGVVLTWAIKGQGGHQHINEQNNEYIIHEMTKRGMRYDRCQSMLFRKSVTWWPWLRNTIMVFHKLEHDTDHDQVT